MKTLLTQFKNLFKNNSGSNNEYQLAVKKYQSQPYSNLLINVAEDLFTYKDELEQQFGKDYLIKTEEFIGKSMILTKDIPPYQLIDPANLELLKKEQKNDKCYRFIHFIKMVTEIYLIQPEPNSIFAKSYIKIGLSLLNQSEPYYNLYLKKFLEYKQEIIDREWERN